MIKSELLSIRLSMGYKTQKEFAEFLKVNSKRYYNWENGVSRPNLEEALKISGKLNKTVNEIWSLED